MFADSREGHFFSVGRHPTAQVRPALVEPGVHFLLRADALVEQDVDGVLVGGDRNDPLLTLHVADQGLAKGGSRLNFGGLFVIL